MDIIDELGQKVYATEVKEILEKIDGLELDNHLLTKQLEESQTQHLELIDQHTVLQKDLQLSEKECEVHRK